MIDTLGPTRDTPVDGPLLPTALRRPAVGVAAACAALLAALAVVVAGTSTATPSTPGRSGSSRPTTRCTASGRAWPSSPASR
ncbi:hypothetical protein ACFQV8_35320 [Pseudonocardia benzenivorans]